MPEDLEHRLVEADRPRELPPGLVARLEAAMSKANEDGPVELSGVGASRPLPQETRFVLERSLASESQTMLAAADAARDLPVDVAARLEAALASEVPVLRRPRLMRAMSIAAAVMLLAGGMFIGIRSGVPGVGEAVPPLRGLNLDAGTFPDAGLGSGTGTVAGPLTIPPEFPADGSVSGGTSGTGGGVAWTAPPFAFGDYVTKYAPSYTAGPSMPSGGAVPPPPLPPMPVHLGIVEGDADQVAGFNAYVGALNGNGGIRGRHVEIHAVSGAHPSPVSIATVNLSSQPIATADGAPTWSRGPLIETFAATEDLLRGDVYGFASAPERQAHLIANHLFPQSAQGSTAIIYTAGSSLFTSTIPAALETVLRARNVTFARVAFDRSASTHLLVPGDAAFLSMDATDASAWIAAAGDASYARGVGGVYPLLDEARRAPDELKLSFASPYSLAGPNELTALRAGAKRVTIRTIQGWVDAKMLAVALWLQDANDPAGMRESLQKLSGYGNSLCPAYGVRAGTRSRTPEAVIFSLDEHGLHSQTGFLTDPF